MAEGTLQTLNLLQQHLNILQGECYWNIFFSPKAIVRDSIILMAFSVLFSSKINCRFLMGFLLF